MKFMFGFNTHQEAADFINFTKYNLTNITIEDLTNETNVFVEFGDDIHQLVYALAGSIKHRRAHEVMDKEIGK